MSPTELKALEKKIDRLEAKLDFVVKNLSFSANEKEWLEEATLVKKLDIIAQTEKVISEKKVKL